MIPYPLWEGLDETGLVPNFPVSAIDPRLSQWMLPRTVQMPSRLYRTASSGLKSVGGCSSFVLNEIFFVASNFGRSCRNRS